MTVIAHAMLSGTALLILMLFTITPAISIAQTKLHKCATVGAGLAQLVEFSARANNGDAGDAGDAVKVQGMLRKPRTTRTNGTSAALIVLHGSRGMATPRCYGAAIERFTQWGYLTLLIDSTSQWNDARGRFSYYNFKDQARHARGAATYLASLPHVDPERIGIVGWSKGGLAAMTAITGWGQQGNKSGNMGAPIGAAAAFYPFCPNRSPPLLAPLLVLIGKRDAVVSVSRCEQLRRALPAGRLTLVVYPNADHAFDAPWSVAHDPPAAADAAARLRRHFDTHLLAKQK